MNTKTEEGVMIVKDGKAWAREVPHLYNGDGYVDMVDGEIFEGEYVTKPSDVTYQGSPYIIHLKDAKIVKARRRVTVELLP